MELNSILFDKQFIVSRTKYIANDITPIAIKPFENSETRYMLLFRAVQSNDERVLFFQLVLNADNRHDIKYIHNLPIYIDNIQDSSDEVHKIYKQYISQMNNENLYTTDFAFDQAGDYPLYFNCEAFHNIDVNHIAALDVFTTKDNFIRIMMYFNQILHTKKIDKDKDPMVNPQVYTNIEILPISSVRLDCTRVIPIIENDKTQNILTSHYTLFVGAKKYGLNFEFTKQGDNIKKHLLIPMFSKEFKSAEYDKDITVQDLDCFYSSNYLYITTYFKDHNNNDKAKVFKLSDNLYKTLPIYNPNIIFKEGEII